MKLEEFYEICDAVQPNENGCMIWPRWKNPKGYGLTDIDKKLRRPSRLVLERKLGRKIKPKFNALHHCDNPACINPEHLYEGTQQDNMDDRYYRHGHGSGSPKSVLQFMAKRIKL
jgi:hypothetical protein